MRRLSVTVLILGVVAIAQSPESSVYRPELYPKTRFAVTQTDTLFGEVDVRLIQVKSREIQAASMYCSAWIEVRQGAAVKQRLAFLNIEPVGSSFGLFLPTRQPLADALIVVKEGDYDGRMIMIGRDGTITNLPGGYYFLTADRDYFIGLYARDDAPLVVVNVSERKTVIDASNDKDFPQVQEFYRDRRGYFFTEHTDGDEQVYDGHIFRIDLEHHRVMREAMTKNELAVAQKVRYDFSPESLPNCTTK